MLDPEFPIGEINTGEIDDFWQSKERCADVSSNVNATIEGFKGLLSEAGVVFETTDIEAIVANQPELSSKEAEILQLQNIRTDLIQIGKM